MPKQMTAEQVLKVIYEVRADAFADSRRLSALFADYSGGRLKAQQNQLDIFLKCDGNTCILNLRNAPKQKQQAEYHRLIQEMVSNYGMQEEVALEISGAFWRVVIGMEPPVSIGESAPVKAPVIQALSEKTDDSGMTPEEMYLRGESFYNAPDIPRRQWWSKAIQWFEKAAERNHLEAQKRLGNMYSMRAFENEGIYANPVKAAYWYRRAAEQGDPQAQLDLGRRYRDGVGVEQDYDKAVYWCCKAAEQNYFFAMGELRYLYGYRLNQPEKAVYWSRRAAEQGYTEEQWRLGQMYEQGFGVAKDDSQAVYWYRKAAEQDTPIAMDALSRCYREGIGTAKDPVQADYWQRKAQAHGYSPKAVQSSANTNAVGRR